MAKDRGTRIKDLRQALHLTHDMVADQSGGHLERTDVSKAENNRNQANTGRWYRGLSQAFGISADDLVNYLDGRLSIEQVLVRRSSHPPPDGGGKGDNAERRYATAATAVILDGLDAEVPKQWLAKQGQNWRRLTVGEMYLGMMAHARSVRA